MTTPADPKKPEDINARLDRRHAAGEGQPVENQGRPLLSICQGCQADISTSCLVGLIKLPTIVSGPPTIHEHRLVPGALIPAEATVLILLRPQRCPECGEPVLYENQTRPLAAGPGKADH